MVFLWCGFDTPWQIEVGYFLWPKMWTKNTKLIENVSSMVKKNNKLPKNLGDDRTGTRLKSRNTMVGVEFTVSCLPPSLLPSMVLSGDQEKITELNGTGALWVEQKADLCKRSLVPGPWALEVKRLLVKMTDAVHACRMLCLLWTTVRLHLHYTNAMRTIGSEESCLPSQFDAASWRTAPVTLGPVICHPGHTPTNYLHIGKDLVKRTVEILGSVSKFCLRVTWF